MLLTLSDHTRGIFTGIDITDLFLTFLGEKDYDELTVTRSLSKTATVTLTW